LTFLDDFYQVFSINMRDLGSPVHSKKLVQNVLMEFSKEAKIAIVYQEKKPIACGFFIGFKNMMWNPWSSALKKCSKIRPNYLLYWAMLEYASNCGYNWFDFGRSSPGEGTYKFKQQWGAHPNPLYWQYVSLNGKEVKYPGSEKTKFDKAIQYWQKLPVSVTKMIGPMIRKHIGL